MILTVTVTQDDINDGHRGNPRYCPISLALSKLGPSANISVTHRCIWYTFNNRNEAVPLEPHLMEWVMNYDRKGKDSVHPITFNIFIDNAHDGLFPNATQGNRLQPRLHTT